MANKNATKRVRLSSKRIKKIAMVVGKCKCGKEAFVTVVRNGKIIKQCFECSDRDSKPAVMKIGYRKDKKGFWYDVEDKFRVSSCCKAAVTFHDETLCCKNCWNEVPLELNNPPAL